MLDQKKHNFKKADEKEFKFFFENKVLVQERIIKHLTKKLGLTKLDLERIQHEAIAKVINSLKVKTFILRISTINFKQGLKFPVFKKKYI